MQNTTVIAKKIDKLKNKICEIDERIKNEVQLKQDYQKEIEELEAQSILYACKQSNITAAEALESFDIYSLIRKSGFSVDEIQEFLAGAKEEKKNVE